MSVIPRQLLALGLVCLGLACRSPLADLPKPKSGPFALAVPPVALEDHSRTLKRIRDIAPGEPNTPAARAAALELHRLAFDTAFRTRAQAEGLWLDPSAPLRLELTLTTVGEVRTKYIVYGILSGVAWGVGTGLLTHNARLAVGLGAFELVEESVFWIAGSSLFGRYSAPVVLEAQLLGAGASQPLWTETYFVIGGGRRLKDFPEDRRKVREVQLQASLARALDKLFEDLAALPGRPTAAPR